jgi:hypothetical protein
MKGAENLLDRKLELAHWLFRLDDEAMLAQIEDLIRVLVSEEQAAEPLPQAHLDAIAKGDADAVAGNVVTMDAFRKKYARYGI